MELSIARQIIDTLAQGIHPVTGEPMPDDSPYNAPPIIRALHSVSRALDGPLPANEVALPPEHVSVHGIWRDLREIEIGEGFDSKEEVDNAALDNGGSRPDAYLVVTLDRKTLKTVDCGTDSGGR